MAKGQKSGRSTLIVGIVLAVISLAGIIFILGTASNSDEVGEALVLVSRQEVPAGMLALDALDKGYIQLQAAPAAQIPPSGFIISGSADFAGEALEVIESILWDASFTQPLPAGSIVPIGYLSWHGDLNLPDGMVATAIEVDAVRGAGGLLKPGDRVDILASYTSAEIDATGGFQDVPKTMVLLQDIQVLEVHGVTGQNASLEPNIPGSGEYDIAVGGEVETSEENNSESGSGYEGASRQSDYDPVNMVPVLAVSLEDAARINYMNTYADAVALVIRKQGDPVQELDAIRYSMQGIGDILSGLDADTLVLPEGEEIAMEEMIDLQAMLDLLNSMEQTILELQAEEQAGVE